MSCVLQGGLTYFAVQRYRMGVSEQFASGIDQDQMGGGGGAGGQPAPSPYSAYPGQGGMGEGMDPYQQAPFSQGPVDQKPAPGDFQPPTYWVEEVSE
jgi:hypothetical protein